MLAPLVGEDRLRMAREHTKNAREKGATLAPQQFAEIFVDEDFAG